MALSVCCVTSVPRRAAAALAAVRERADEVVVAVDVSGGERDLRPLGAIADSVFEIELDTFPEPAMAWLHARCSGDWILRLDDDEALSPRLLDRLAQLTRARDVVQYWLARRWLYPDRASWLDQWPWFPDFQGRLVRNDARLWFPGLCHSSVAPALPARYLDDGIYHLAHLLLDRPARERKVRAYLQVDDALRDAAADPQLATYYLPERHPDARLAAVDPDELAAIDGFLGALEAADSPGAKAPPARRVAGVDQRERWAGRTLGEGAYRASIHPVDVHRRLVAGDLRPFRVRVRNDGSEWWPGGEDRQPLIRACYRWLTPRGDVHEAEGVRTALPHPLAPGQSCLVEMCVVAPSAAGTYALQLDLVHEHVRWFECDAVPVRMLVTTPAMTLP